MLKLTVLAMTFVYASSAFAEQQMAQLAACTQIENSEQRLACFDTVTKKLIGDSVDSTDNAEGSKNADEPQESVADNTQPEALSDSVGGGDFADAAGKVKESYTGRVTSCKKTADRRWFFIFDNGQVWKQVDRRKRRYKNCDFDVTLTKDSFGYVMEIDGQKGSVRVDRRR